jgi:hypothetical protein
VDAFAAIASTQASGGNKCHHRPVVVGVISRLSSFVPDTSVISAQIWSTTPIRRPSLKFGTHSTI